MNTALSPKPGKPTRVVDWLTAKQNQPGYFLIAIIGLALWAAGFIDLVTHTSNPRVLLGRYSIPYALFLLAFAAGFVLWLGALLRARRRADYPDCVMRRVNKAKYDGTE